jgi:hypothetical protein
MEVSVLDLQGTSHDFQFDGDSFTGEQLLSQLAGVPGIDLEKSALVFRNERVDSKRIFKGNDFDDGSLFVLFDFRLFPQRSYPQVDHGFDFGGTRYSELTMNVPDQFQSEQSFSTILAPEPISGDETYEEAVRRIAAQFEFPGEIWTHGEIQPEYFVIEDGLAARLMRHLGGVPAEDGNEAWGDEGGDEDLYM